MIRNDRIATAIGKGQRLRILHHESKSVAVWTQLVMGCGQHPRGEIG
jgi:hypothetical protein